MSGFFDSLFGSKYDREIKELRKKTEKEPQNFRLLVHIGDLLAHAGKKEEALQTYRQASEKYSKNGYLIQAIAVNKIIARLDPSQVQSRSLAELYAQPDAKREEKRELQLTGEAEKVSEKKFPVYPLFSDLNQEELSRIIEKMVAHKFPKGSIICKEGDPGDSIFVISHGRVGIFRKTPEGGKLYLNELRAGDFFGEFGFFAGSGRQATVEALEDTDVLELSKQDIQMIIQEHPGISEVLLKFYRERVVDTLLASSGPFRTFSPQERKKILDKVTIEGIPIGTTVLEEGGQGASLYIIKKGEMEVFTHHPPNPPVILARLKQGDFFGEVSFLTGLPCTASVKAILPTELVRLRKEDFDQILVNHSEATEFLLQSVYIRVKNKYKVLGVEQDNPAKAKMV